MRRGVMAIGTAFLSTLAMAQDIPPGSPDFAPPPDAKFLPPFRLTGTLSGETRPDGTEILTAEDGAAFTIGDLRIDADRITAERIGTTIRRVEASGNVRVQRGDETLRGDLFVFEGTEGTFRTGKAVIVSPPFDIDVTGIEATVANGFQLSQPRIGVGRGGEFGLFAESASVTTGESSTTLRLRNATFSLLGVRVLTLRRVSLPLKSRETSRDASGLGSIFSLQSSRISGPGISLGVPYTVSPDTTGALRVSLTKRGGIQPIATLRKEFLTAFARSQRPIYSLPGQIASAVQDASKIRQLITARDLPPPYDPVLDFTDILPESNPIRRPASALSREGFFQATIAYNREGEGRRGGMVLLTRLPEVMASVRLPLSGVITAADNATARRYLKSPHLTLDSEGSLGYFQERQYDQPGRPSVSATRAAITAGVGIAPILIGDSTLATLQMQGRWYGYGGKGDYRVGEFTIAVQHVLGERSAISAAYFLRDQAGKSPFLTDQIDARYEGQVRAQYAFSKNRLVLAALARYDGEQRRIFDYQFALAYRRGSLEPRLAYRTLNRQFVFALTFPGLTER
jgi:hypothetical protein